MYENARVAWIKKIYSHDVTHIDLVELAEVHGLEAVDGWSYVLAVGTLFHNL